MNGSWDSRLAVVLLALLLCSPALATDPIPPDPTPTPKVRPRGQNTISFKIPTKLKLGESNRQATYALADKPLQTITLKVDSTFFSGAEYRVFIYPEGEPRPQAELISGICPDVQALSGWTGFRSGKNYGRYPGQKTVIEVEIIIFQTDVPPSTVWEPYGKKYKVLWTGSVKETVGQPAPQG